jgi:hypothetical protein
VARPEVGVRLEAIDHITKVIGTVQRGFANFGSFLAKRFVITLGDVQRAVRAMGDALESALQARGQRRALEQQVQNLDSFLGKLKEVSRGTISTSKLIETSSRALLLGIPAQDVSRLLEIARVSAIASGREIGKAFGDITLGLSRQSPKILDNIGLQIDLEEQYKKTAAALDKQTDELTEVEKRQALVNEVFRIGEERIELFKKASEGLQDQMAKFKADMIDMKDIAKSLFLEFVEGGAISISASSDIEEFNKKLEEQSGFFRQAGIAVGKYFQGISEGKPSILAMIDAVALSTEELKQQEIAQLQAAEAQKHAKWRVEELKRVTEEKAQADRDAKIASDALKLATEQLTTAYQGAVDGMSVFGEATSIQLIQKQWEIAEAIFNVGQALGRTHPEYVRYARIGNQAIGQLQKRIDSLVSGHGDLEESAKDAGGGLDDLGTSAKDAAGDIDELSGAERDLATQHGLTGREARLLINTNDELARSYNRASNAARNARTVGMAPGGSRSTSSFAQIGGGTYTFVTPAPRVGAGGRIEVA